MNIGAHRGARANRIAQRSLGRWIGRFGEEQGESGLEIRVVWAVAQGFAIDRCGV
jgi:hypothetical protein